MRQKLSSHNAVRWAILGSLILVVVLAATVLMASLTSRAQAIKAGPGDNVARLVRTAAGGLGVNAPRSTVGGKNPLIVLQQAEASVQPSADCSAVYAQGNTAGEEESALLTIVGVDANGDPVNITDVVTGTFSITFTRTSPGTFGPHPITLTATLSNEVTAIGQFSADVACGPASGTLSIDTFDCDGVVFAGSADITSTLAYTLSRGGPGSQAVGPGAFEAFVPWNPVIQGLMGPFTVAATGTLVFTDTVGPQIDATAVLTCSGTG